MSRTVDFTIGEQIELENVDQVIVSQVNTYINKGVNMRRGILDHASYIHLGLVLAKAQVPFPIAANYNLCFLNSEMKVHKGTFKDGYTYSSSNEVHEIRILTGGSFVDMTQDYLADDGSLNLLFRIVTTSAQHNNDEEDDTDIWREGPSARFNQEALSSFLDNGNFSDLTLSTKTDSFPASKIILAGTFETFSNSQSPVFRAMFLSEMLESKENAVKIEDFSGETVKVFLEFLYTGQSDSLTENAVELLKISDKYQVDLLKRECEKVLMKKLNKENAADVLILATFYNSPKLKLKVVSFVKKCRKAVTKTRSFKELKKLYPEILLDFYTEFE